MDTIKIGNFIKECRNKKQMTQQQLGEKLFVEAKTISKWETGKGIPDVSIMYSLCEVLDISLKELFLGEKINDEHKEKELEKIILETFEREKRINKRNIIGEIIVGIILILLGLISILTVSYASLSYPLRLLFIVLTILCECVGIGGLAILDANTGYYECESCHERFVPAMKEYVFGLHTMKKRKLPCPKCGKKTWCSKKISKE